MNIEPIAPSLENMLVPVPVVFSPAAGCRQLVFLAYGIVRASRAYGLIGGLVNATCEVLVLQCAVGALLEGFGTAVSVHDA